uniref:Uncharacterized LOC100692589 n=1 Tax=Oreochromis niloticus TaxID=8128 RepID=A0A669CPF3_ORENI
MGAGLLFLVCAAAVPYSAEARQPYNGLPEIYKKGVNLVRQELTTHSRIRHRYLFLKTVGKLETEGGFGEKYIYHHFLLNPTWCPRGITESYPQRCQRSSYQVSKCPQKRKVFCLSKHQQNSDALYVFIAPQPLDCVICYKAIADQIEDKPEPHIHCIQGQRLTEEMKKTRLGHYRNMIYHSGAPTLLALTAN